MSKFVQNKIIDGSRFLPGTLGDKLAINSFGNHNYLSEIDHILFPIEDQIDGALVDKLGVIFAEVDSE